MILQSFQASIQETPRTGRNAARSAAAGDACSARGDFCRRAGLDLRGAQRYNASEEQTTQHGWLLKIWFVWLTPQIQPSLVGSGGCFFAVMCLCLLLGSLPDENRHGKLPYVRCYPTPSPACLCILHKILPSESAYSPTQTQKYSAPPGGKAQKIALASYNNMCYHTSAWKNVPRADGTLPSKK